MVDILTRIVEYKKSELAETKKRVPAASLIEMAADISPALDFKKAITCGEMQIIAEAKKASPSRGLLCPGFDPVLLARAYQENGAAAISVLTETGFFQGKLEYLQSVKTAVAIPVLRKDFIFESYQVYESRAGGADAMLLIAAILEQKQLADLLKLSRDIGLYCLVEVHNEEEIEKALKCGADIIGINNRDLKTFVTDVNATCRLRSLLPENIAVVSESGISDKAGIDLLKQHKIDAILVGEALVTAPDPGARLKEMKRLLA